MASSDLYALEQEDDSTELTVYVPVPASTERKDVSITATAERLRVSVAGHPRQPAVFSGQLYYDIDPDTLTWELKGTGEDRKLAISLDKAEPINWDEGLLRQHIAPEAPPPDLPRDLSKVKTASAPAAAASLTSVPASQPAPKPPASTSTTPPSEKAAASTPAQKPATSTATVPRSKKPVDYSKWDSLDVSDDDEDFKKEPTFAGRGQSAEIWNDLMSGKKKLLTKQGIASKEAIAKLGSNAAV